MKQELEIGGKTYILNANRKVATFLQNSVEIGKDGTAKFKVGAEEEFYVLLITEQPDMTQEQANKLLAMADEEYGVGEMTLAINQMINSVFTQGSDTSHKKKTIPWVIKEEEPKNKE